MTGADAESQGRAAGCGSEKVPPLWGGGSLSFQREVTAGLAALSASFGH